MSPEVWGAAALTLEAGIFFLLQESLMASREHPVMEYIMTVLRLWGNHISGPVLAIVSIVSAFAYAYYADKPTAMTATTKYVALATGVASIVLMFVAQYEAWKVERDALEAEELSHEGSNIRGDIKLGYLETRSARLSPTFEHGIPGSVEYLWSDLPEKYCWVCFFVDAVNQNSTPARFRSEKATVELTLNGKRFHGRWQQILIGLAVDDDQRSDIRLIDMFDGWFAGGQGLQMGIPWLGDMAFLVEPFDRALIVGKDSVDADVKISLYDTLGKEHTIETAGVELLFGRLHVHGETPKQHYESA
jgi:hypothetical protein